MASERPRSPNPLSPEVESRPGLLRALGPGMAMAMVVGNVIGSGIFLKPGVIAGDAGRFPLIMAAWILGGLFCLLGALCFAELGAMLPRAGGLYVYLREAYGRPVAFLFGWCDFLFSRPAAIGALATAFVAAFSQAIDATFSATTAVCVSIGVIVSLGWINMMGVIWGGRVQALVTLIKAGFLAAIALLPFVAAAMGGPGIELANVSTSVVPRQPNLSTQFAAAMLAVLWAYNGWHAVTPVAEEIRRPQRNIPLALIGGLGVLIVLYVGVNVAYHVVLSMPEMAQAGQNAAQEMVRKLLVPAGNSAARAGVAAISMVIMCSTFGAINSNVLNGPRISFAMGRDDVFVRVLGRVHANYRTPAVAIATLTLMSVALVTAAAVLVATVAELKDSNVFDLLTNFVVFSSSLFYVLAVLAVVVLRWKHPEWERPYRTFGYPVVPLLYLTFYAWFLYYVYRGSPHEAKTGLVLVALGLPVYYGWRAWAKRHPERIGDGQ